MVRGFSWTVIPITWKNRRTGISKLKIQEMGSRYLFICLYVLLEKHLTRDYRVKPDEPRVTSAQPPERAVPLEIEKPTIETPVIETPVIETPVIDTVVVDTPDGANDK
jgi:hypothetical protein